MILDYCLKMVCSVHCIATNLFASNAMYNIVIQVHALNQKHYDVYLVRIVFVVFYHLGAEIDQEGSFELLSPRSFVLSPPLPPIPPPLPIFSLGPLSDDLVQGVVEGDDQSCLHGPAQVQSAECWSQGEPQVPR